MWHSVSKNLNCIMNYKLSIFTISSSSSVSQIRKISNSVLNRRKNHYDSLGVQKNATQSEVKEAYYNLSKVYHPDMNPLHTVVERATNAEKFRDITEAYEILGNVRTRKLYDKGFLGLKRSESTTNTDDPLHKFYQSREKRTRPPTTGGQQPIYNFDEWSRHHYGNTFQKTQEIKNRRVTYEKMQGDELIRTYHRRVVYVAVVLLAICMIFRDSKDYDQKSVFVMKNLKSVSDE